MKVIYLWLISEGIEYVKSFSLAEIFPIKLLEHHQDIRKLCKQDASTAVCQVPSVYQNISTLEMTTCHHLLKPNTNKTLLLQVR